MGKLKTALEVGGKFLDKHLPEVLTGIAIVGLGGAVGSAIKSAPKAVKAVENAKIDKITLLERDAEDSMALDIYRNDEGEPLLDKISLTPWEYVKTLFPIYWPTALMTACSGTCMVLATRTGIKRSAALITALGMSEKNLKEYQEKAKELFGEKKEMQLRKEIAKDRAMDAPDEDQIIQTTHGSVLFCIKDTGTYFRSSVEAVQRGMINFNAELQREGIRSVADLLSCDLDISIVDSWAFEHLVWTYDDKSDLLDYTFIPATYYRTKEPCHVIEFGSRPKWH